jgi:hypothetical protein
MENDITANPDYQLIMSFLKSIRPGDMSDEAATQLKMIGERIQSGGSLSDQEREMFQSVMGAMPQMPMDQGSAVREGEMPMARMPMDPGSAARQSELPSLDGMTYGPSSGVSSSLAPDTSMRPRPRPASMEYDIINPKYEVEGGGQIRRQDIMNSLSLNEKQKRAMLGEK